MSTEPHVSLPKPKGLVEWELYEVFYISIILKGLNGILEIILGSLLLFTNIPNLLLALLENELIDDPNNFITSHLQGILVSNPSATHFGGIYLLAHGIVKVIIMAGILRNKFWAYPAAMAIMSLFIIYQVIRVYMHHSILLAILTIFDCVVVWLIYHEYKRLRYEKR